MTSVRVHRRARRYQSRLPRDVSERIDAAIERLAGGERVDVRAIQGLAGIFRLRVGPYRVIFREEGDTIVIEEIGPRGGAYRG